MSHRLISALSRRIRRRSILPFLLALLLSIGLVFRLPRRGSYLVDPAGAICRTGGFGGGVSSLAVGEYLG